MTRALAVLPVTIALLLVLAPAALAEQEALSGEGLYGLADDKVVTNTGFIVIAFFPLFILAMSLLQWRLDKRKERRKEAAARLASQTQGSWQSGW
jgi:fumarate reductase subunit D